MNFEGKTFFVTGASRGIGLAIAKKLGSAGARIVIAAKTAEAHPKLEGTIFTAAEEIKAAGGECLPLRVDIRDEDAIQKAVDETVGQFGGLDGLILNASAIFPFPTEKTESKRFDLMHDVIVKGHFFTVQKALPYLKKSSAPTILALCPPLQNLHEKWLAPMVAYSMMKFSLSMMVKGWAEEFKKDKIQVNGLWPRTYIATAAVKNLLGGDDAIKRSRRTEIVSDAAHWILSNHDVTGQFFLDEEIILKTGGDPNSYALDPSQKPMLDAYID